MRKHLTYWKRRYGLLATLCFAIATPLQAQQNRTDSVELDVLMRGPVHEGFAEPATSSDLQGSAETRGTLRLPEPIPDPLDEQPARIRPSDNQRRAVWLPGYWGVEDQENLCWVSGTWRYSPPGMQWVPGYWANQRNESVWVPGFWAKESAERLTYLPAPPRPPADAAEYRQPRDGRFWVPGSYVWQNNQYRWQEGFWADAQQNWVWVPQRLVRTPRGYLQAPGHWDYPIDRRGTLFAPVRYSNRLIGRNYRPTVAINVAQALTSWFVRPNYGHYYFGSYYGDRYNDFGLVPWGPYTGRNVNYYDPLYAYYATTRSDYLQNLVRSHRSLVGDGNVNLPVTFADYQQSFRSGIQSPLGNLARTVDQLVDDGKTEGFDSFEVLTASEGGNVAQQIESQVQQLRQFAEGRRQAEVGAEAQADTDATVTADADADADADAIADADGQEDRQQRSEDRQDGRQDDARMPLRDRAEDAADRAEDAADRTEDATERAEDATERAEDRATDAADQVRDRASDATDRAAEAADSAVERASDAADRIGDRGKDAADQAEQAADNLRDRAEATVEGQGNQTRDRLQQMRDRGRDQATERAQRLREQSGRLGGRARQEVGQSQPPAGNSFDLSPFRRPLQQRQPNQPAGDIQGAPQPFTPPSGLRGRIRGEAEASGSSSGSVGPAAGRGGASVAPAGGGSGASGGSATTGGGATGGGASSGGASGGGASGGGASGVPPAASGDASTGAAAEAGGDASGAAEAAAEAVGDAVEL